MLANWDPFQEMSRMQDDLARWSSGDRAKNGFRPAVDIHESPEAYSLAIEVPGVKEEDLHVELENGVLTIRGERKFEKATENKDTGYRHVERSYGSFLRRFAVPDAIKSDAIEAKLDAGVLNVRLPKDTQPKGRKIAISKS
jgi:HSP20 family protein